MVWSTIKAFFKDLNPTLTFYKWLVSIMIVVAVSAVSFREGMTYEREKAHKQEVATLSEQIVEERRIIVKELEVRQERLVRRMEEINKDSKEAARLQRELDTIGGKLNELIQKRPSNPACAPSRSVWEEYRKLAEATKPTS